MSQVPSQKLKFEGKVLIRQRDADAAYLFVVDLLVLEMKVQINLVCLGEPTLVSDILIAFHCWKKTDKFNRQIQQTNMTP